MRRPSLQSSSVQISSTPLDVSSCSAGGLQLLQMNSHTMNSHMIKEDLCHAYLNFYSFLVIFQDLKCRSQAGLWPQAVWKKHRQPSWQAWILKHSLTLSTGYLQTIAIVIVSLFCFVWKLQVASRSLQVATRMLFEEEEEEEQHSDPIMLCN